jgi:hypothetical protein
MDYAVGVRLLAGTGIFIQHHLVVPIQPPIEWGLAAKRPEGEADCSPHRVVAKNTWSFSQL